MEENADVSETYSRFIEIVKKMGNLGYAYSVLSWDQEVMMPDGGIQARASQKAVLASTIHEILISDELGELIEKLEESVESLDEYSHANLREAKREHSRAKNVPPELVGEIASTSSEAIEIWKKARRDSDFDKFAPYLEKLVELKKEYAQSVDPTKDAYAVLLEDYEPDIEIEDVVQLFDELRKELVPLISKVKGSEERPNMQLLNHYYSERKQKKFGEIVLKAMGYDFDHGRLDVSAHPFTSGNVYDTRITTRYSKNDIKSALSGTIHEGGHALYNLGLPKEHYATPVGEPRSLGIHESQSRIWENHVGRSIAFWEHFLPILKGIFPNQLSAYNLEEFYRAMNNVEPGLIRVEADELTYNLHIILRFEIERALFNNEIRVEELPGIWNDKMKDFLGIVPPDDSMGVLQDIHWAMGIFGYFPTYTLGTVTSAQLYNAAKKAIPDLEDKFRKGELIPFKEWLNENIHRFGCLFKTDELIERATGEKLNPKHYIDYLNEKYTEIYGL